MPALFLVLAGCPKLPDYALPNVTKAERARASSVEVFSYRQLTIEDFRAISLPEDKKNHADRINAHSCIQIRPRKDSKFKITRGHMNNELFYFGSIEHIAFEAVMVPSCSWWNPNLPEKKKAYVLEHEQIHFALVELAARRLTIEAGKTAESFLSVQAAYQDVRKEISEELKRMTRQAMDDILKEHTDFDNETSLYFDPKAQKWWREKVEQKLFETERKK